MSKRLKGVQNGEKSHYKYFLYYRKLDGELYAYTDKKKYASLFHKFRNVEYFIERCLNLSKEDLKDLHDNNHGEMIELYDFDLFNNISISLPITQSEKITIEHVGIQTVMVDLCRIAGAFPADIFQKKIKKMLDSIAYSAYHDVWASGKMVRQNPPLKPDYLTIFLHFYKDSVKGGDLFESLLLLSGR